MDTRVSVAFVAAEEEEKDEEGAEEEEEEEEEEGVAGTGTICASNRRSEGSNKVNALGQDRHTTQVGRQSKRIDKE